jgi:predicted glycoside hydrolase/deacetylase ChbG (UPF0249 family)
VFGFAASDVFFFNGALSARFARRCASLTTVGAPLVPLEWQLIAHGHAERVDEIPCRFLLRTEKAAPRLWLEIASLAWNLPRVARHAARGHYAPLPEACLQAVTADDWGLSPGVNAGILDLARAGVVRRVSVMANEPHLREGLAELLRVPGLETGLHFNLSHGSLAHAPTLSPSAWLKRAGRSKQAAETRAWVTDELRAQLAAARAAGIPIRYLDGHHHIHLVPGWIDWIVPILREAQISTVRIPFDYRLLWTPKFPLAVLAWLAARRARRAGLRSLPCRYPSPATVAHPPRLKRVLRRAVGSEIITHPAACADLHEIFPPDPYNEPRLLEWRALRSVRT